MAAATTKPALPVYSSQGGGHLVPHLPGFHDGQLSQQAIHYQMGWAKQQVDSHRGGQVYQQSNIYQADQINQYIFNHQSQAINLLDQQINWQQIHNYQGGQVNQKATTDQGGQVNQQATTDQGGQVNQQATTDQGGQVNQQATTDQGGQVNQQATTDQGGHVNQQATVHQGSHRNQPMISFQRDLIAQQAKHQGGQMAQLTNNYSQGQGAWHAAYNFQGGQPTQLYRAGQAGPHFRNLVQGEPAPCLHNVDRSHPVLPPGHAPPATHSDGTHGGMPVLLDQQRGAALPMMAQPYSARPGPALSQHAPLDEVK